MEQIASFVTQMNQNNEFIDSAKHVQEEMNKEFKVEDAIKAVTNVMKKDLNMRYRKITSISIHSNSPRNMVLR